MKSLFRNILARPGGIIALAVAAALSGGAAHAAGTLSGTIIGNLATLSYSVGGTAQPAIGSTVGGNTAGTGTATTFVVDNKVNLSVVEGSFNGTAIVNAGAVTLVVPGTSAQVTSFVVTNTGNTPQGYTFVAVNQTNTSALIAGTGDSIDVISTSFRVFIDANGNGIYDAGTDTATSILELLPDASRTVFVLADMPVGATNGQQANIALTATTTTVNTTTAVLQDTGADDPGAVQIVFADAATVELEFVGTSAARNAQATARDAYRIASAVISVAKTSLLVCDPFNGSGTDRKYIPGAIVRWTITISNALGASASATLAQVTDALNANTTFDPNLVTGAGAPATATSCTSGGVPEGATGSGFKIDVTGDTRTGASGTFPRFLTTAGDGDGATHATDAVAIDYGPAMPAGDTYTAGELKPGEAVIVYFNVTIK